MQKNKKNITIAAIVLIIIIILAVAFIRERKTVKTMNEQFKLNKEMLEDEYSELALQYEGYGLRVSNDSLAELLDNERQKMQSLLEELKATKANDARRIRALRKELKTLRTVLKHYVVQIDSLNAENQRLNTENKTVVAKYKKIQKKADNLIKEKETLTKKVTLASILHASNIEIKTLTKKGHKTSRLKKIAKISFSFNLDKNISTENGEKEIFLRIIQPDETPLVNNRDNTFIFEDSYIEYSSKIPIEYAGERMPVEMYYDVTNILYKGKYKVYIFADGYIIGQTTFELD